MSEFYGLPDFGAPIEGGPTGIFVAYGNAPAALVMPDHLDVAMLPDGLPDFQLSLNRPALAGVSQPWGALRMRVEQRCPVEQALAVVRAQMPRATISPALPSGGFARLVPAGGGVGLPDDLLAPMVLNWASLDSVRFMLPRLSIESAGLLKDALLSTTLLVWARLEIEVVGVSPQMPLRVSFKPRALLAATMPEDRRVVWDDLVAALSRGPSVLPITVEGNFDNNNLRRLGEALADRIRTAFGRFVPSAAGDRPTIEIIDNALPDSVQWDLAQPVEARRPWALQLDPLATPRRLAAQSGLAGLVEEHTQPLIDVGVRDIFVAANLPARREGVAAVGVTIRALAHPPERRQDIVQSLDFQSPADEGTVRIRFSPKEPVSYTYAPYVVIYVGNNIRRVDTPEQTHDSLSLELSPDDFSVAFIPIGATAELLGLASVSGRLTYSAPGGAAVAVPFALSPTQPSTSLPLPRDAADGAIYVSAVSHDGAGELALGPLPAATSVLGPWSFPQYGTQRVSIEATFPSGRGFVAIDLIAEGQTESTQTVTTLQLTPEKPAHEWTYFAASPFRAGYRYRHFVAGGQPSPWSEVQAASQPLKLVADQPADPTDPPAFDLRGVHLYADAASPSILRYIPAAPIPARTSDGRPLMALYNLGAYSILQLSVRFNIEDSELDRLRVEMASQHFDLSAATFQPAPVVVDKVTVCLGQPTAEGHPLVLATSAGSGFPPWDAIFSIKLTPEQAAGAAKALSGQPGMLTVAVKANLPSDVAATFPDRPAYIERIADVANWADDGGGPNHPAGPSA